MNATKKNEPTAVGDLANQLDVSYDSVWAYVENLIKIDGESAVIAETPPGMRDTHLTPDAADFLREMHAAGHWGE